MTKRKISGLVLAAACFGVVPSAYGAPVSGWVIDFNITPAATVTEPTPGSVTLAAGTGGSTLNATGIRANYADLTLTDVGSSLTVAATMQMNNMSAGGGGNLQFRFGAFNNNGSATTANWLGYWQSNPVGTASALYERAPSTGNWNSLTGATQVGGTFANTGAMPAGTYLISFQYTRQASNALLIQTTMLQTLTAAGIAPTSPYSVTRSIVDTTVNTFTFNRIGYFFGGSMNATTPIVFTNIDATVRTSTFWNLSTGGTWGTAGNWTSVVPNAGGAVASFGGGTGPALTGPATIDLGGVTRTVGTLGFNDSANAFTLSNGSLTLDDSLNRATVKVDNGSHVINTNVVTTARGADINVFNATDTLGITGNRTGTGTVTKTGSGTIVATGTVSVPGITVQSGSLVLGNGGTSGSLVGGVSVGGGAIVAVNRSDDVSLAGVVSGAGGLRQLGTGALTLNAANSFSGPMTITSGKVVATTLANGGTNSSIGSSTNVAGNLVFGGGTLQYTGSSVVIDRNFTINAGTTAVFDVTDSAATLAVAGAAGASTGGLTKVGAGTLAINGNLAYTGATTVNAGALILNGTHTGGAAYSINGSFGGAGTTASAVSLFGTSSPTVAPGRGSGSIANIGTLTTGSLTVDSGYTFKFDLTASSTIGGTSNDHVIVNGDLSLAAGTTFEVNALSGVLAPGEYGLIRFTGAGPADASSFVLTGTPTVTTRSFSYALGVGSIAAANNYLKLVVTGTPMNLKWNGGNGNSSWDQATTFNWQNVSAFDQQFFAGDTLTFDDTSTNQTVDLVGSLSPTAVTVDTAGTYTFQGTGLVASSGTLNKTGSGTLLLTSSNSYAGAVTISSGTLQIGNNGTAGALTAGSIVNNGTLVMNRTDGVAVASPISGSGGVNALQGNNTLGGNNTFDGPVVISAGTMFLNNGNALGSVVGNTTVAPGARIYVTSGNYTVPEPLLVSGLGDGGGALRVGGNRTLTWTGAITLGATSSFVADGGSRLILGTVGSNAIVGTNVDVVTAGTVQVNGPISIGTGSVAATGQLTVNLGTGVTYSNAPLITGTAQLVKDGLGRWEIGISNAHTGGTKINDGTLAISNANAVGAGNLDLVTNNGGYITSSVLELSGNITVTNPITFPGRPNTTTLPQIRNASGSNTLTGAMSGVTSGAYYYIASDAGLLTVASNYIQTVGTGDRFLTMQGAGNGNWTGSISNGTGVINIVKNGAGTWTFSGPLAITGTTTVNEGILNVTSPLRPVTGSLVVTGAGVANIGGASSADTYTVAGEFAAVNVDAAASVVVTPRVTGNKSKVLIANTITPTGKLDLTNNDAILRGTNVGAVQSLVSAWWNQGSHNNAGGLISSLAGTGSGVDAIATLAVISNDNGLGGTYFSTFDGITVTSADVLVKYTYLGDTDLNGVVEPTDLQALITGIRNGLTGWQNGDTNYDGVVDSIDYANLVTAMRFQSGSFGDPATGVAGTGTVPEPTALALLIAGLPLVSRRRRR